MINLPFGANDVDIYNSLALLTIDININQATNILTNYLVKIKWFLKFAFYVNLCYNKIVINWQSQMYRRKKIC